MAAYNMVLSPALALYIVSILLIIAQIEIEAFSVQPTKYRVSSTTTTTRIKGNFLDNFIVNRKESDDNKPNHRVYKKWKSKEEEARRKANTYQGKKITVSVSLSFPCDFVLEYTTSRVYTGSPLLLPHKNFFFFSSNVKL